MEDLVDLQGVLPWAHQVRTRRLGSIYFPLIKIHENTTNPQKNQNHTILLPVVLVVNHDAGPHKTN